MAQEIKKEINFSAIEKKWQKRWQEAKVFEVSENSKKKKYYSLEMYPYPSASFLHMGHVRNYTIGDVYARFKRMQGFNVLYPMGYDSFGLPAEAAAKKEGIHPKKYTENSIKKIMEYQKALGNSYAWDRTLASHDSEYYKWNQFFFLQFLKKGLAYRGKAPINWCENCQSVLANEEAEGGKCWRCGNDVIQKDMEQWFFKITKYADKLLNDLEKIDWPEKIKTMQKNWIGKSEGVNIFFKLKDEKKILPAFTTRCDTLFSVTFIAIAPENPMIKELVKGTKYENSVNEFVKRTIKEKIEDRINEEKEKEGIFIGKYVINPATKEEIPVYVSNFALMYGTGIVMCDAHDKRDFRFAKKYKIPLKFVISKDGKPAKANESNYAYVGDGILFDSGDFSGMNNREALPKIANWIEKKGIGQKITNYKIKDWLISRQRYWGTPIPIIYCDKCGVVPVPEKDLPVLLPEKVNFEKQGNPLLTSKEFIDVKCPKCSGKAKRETDTMGGFVDSSWYFLRYCDNKNKKEAFNSKKVEYWMPVDQYIGGAEHAVMHLIYARFFTKALKDLGYIKFDEPFAKLFNQGIVYKDGAKMSKSKGNVVFQNEISDKYGIDTARMFLMFVSSPEKQMEWSNEGVEGSYRIINKLIRLKDKINKKSNAKEDHKINATIKKFTENIQNFDYPKAIISFIECLDSFSENISKENYSALLKLISPFCPHISEELWEKIGNKGFISTAEWPVADNKKINENFDIADKAADKIVTDILNIMKIVKEKQGKEAEKIYLYALPKELENYNVEVLSKRIGKKVIVYSVSDKKKYDPESKSSKAKPGKPGIYIE